MFICSKAFSTYCWLAQRDWKLRSEAWILYTVSYQLIICSTVLSVDIPTAFYKLVQLMSLGWGLLLFCFEIPLGLIWEHGDGACALVNLWLINHADIIWLHLEVLGNVGMQMWCSDVPADPQTFGCQCCFPLPRAFSGLATMLRKYSCVFKSVQILHWFVYLRSVCHRPEFGSSNTTKNSFCTTMAEWNGKDICENVFLSL